MDPVGFRVDLLALGSDCRRDSSDAGWLVIDREDPNCHLDAFHPARQDFACPEELRARLLAHYCAHGRDGYLVHYGTGGATDVCYTAILVPADVQVASVSNAEDFACVRTDDLDAWCEAYVAGSPHIPAAPFRDKPARLREAREVHLYLSTVGGQTIGGGSRVRMGAAAFLANGCPVMESWRGDILARARMVRRSTHDDVLALTTARFARVLRRAMPQVREPGRVYYVRLDREAAACPVAAVTPVRPAVSASPATL